MIARITLRVLKQTTGAKVSVKSIPAFCVPKQEWSLVGRPQVGLPKGSPHIYEEKHPHSRMRTQGRSSIPLRSTGGHTRHIKVQTLPGTDTERHQEHLKATPNYDVVLRDNDISKLHKSWDENITELVSGILLELLPICEVNHEINLIDPKKCIHYQLLKFPEHFHEELSQKIERYTTVQWWIPTLAHQVVPMLCILKKSGKLCTVFNVQEQNVNMVMDVTPFPDQDIIHKDMSRATYWSKLDMSKAYDQIHIIPEHVYKMAFTTVLGTFRSQVMQMGDCNAPSTFQRLMTAIFHDCISQFMHVYLDDIFIFLCSIKEHKIHMDADKMQHIHEWRCPRTFNNVQHFLGLVQYLAHYMPDISSYTTSLLGCVRNSHLFEWMLLLDKCFESIKALVCRALILKPIDNNNPDPIWVINDGSKAGVGAIYGQGPDWKTCQPAGFLSKKFSNAQQHYRMHKHKTIAVLKALMKWEDKLLGGK